MSISRGVRKLNLNFFLFFCMVSSTQAQAIHSLGVALGVSATSQSDMNSLISSANTSSGGISNAGMGSATELSMHYSYRFKRSMFEIGVRPSYLMQGSSGRGTSGSYKYNLSGFTLFPMLRMIPLENKIFKFHLQTGIGYGHMTGTIREPGFDTQFSGDRLGLLFGLGAEFCFNKSHCVRVDGNYRYMPVDRNIVSSSTGSSSSLTQVSEGDELEVDNRDLGTTFTGIQGIVGYTYYF